MGFKQFWKIILFTISSFIVFQAVAQQENNAPFDKELSFSSDNDFFALTGTDRYYTNGLFFKYSTVAHHTKATISKKINEWEIGQMIFTPYKREILVVTEMDRPVAGYLYGKFSQSVFTNKNKLFSWGVSLGTVGKGSLAKEMINNYHPFIKVNSDWWEWIWDYQVKDELGINAHGKYAFSLINESEKSLFQVTPVTNLTVGTSFTNASQSVLLQLGRFNKMAEGGYWNAKIDNSNSNTNKNELFFFYEPTVTYQGYDATIQGGMFRNDKGRVTWPVNPFVFTNHVGVYYADKRYSLSFHEFFETKRAKYQFDNHVYGRIQVGYRFRAP